MNDMNKICMSADIVNEFAEILKLNDSITKKGISFYYTFISNYYVRLMPVETSCLLKFGIRLPPSPFIRLSIYLSNIRSLLSVGTRLRDSLVTGDVQETY